MISKKMENMVANSSAIRAMFEEGNRLAKIYGAENVYDFSLGNPATPAPAALNDSIRDLLDEADKKGAAGSLELHGYMENAGYKDVKMVDGGFDALKEAGIETAKGGSEPKAVDVKIDSIDTTHVINTDELKANYDDYKVVDVRADEEYDGETLYGEAKGGHLPGAIHIRYTDLFQKSGMLKSNAEITKMFEDAGITKDDKVVTYCTAGIRSGYMQLILEMCGFKNTQNYDESYYRWCAVEDVEK